MQWSWPHISTGAIPSGIIQVDVEIDDNGVISDSVLFAGHMAYEILEDSVTLKPRVGWAIAFKSNPNEVTNLRKGVSLNK